MTDFPEITDEQFARALVFLRRAFGGFSPQEKRHIAEKRAAYEEATKTVEHAADTGGEFPESAMLCGKCNTKAVVQMDGCMTCLSCGYSKCG